MYGTPHMLIAPIFADSVIKNSLAQHSYQEFNRDEVVLSQSIDPYMAIVQAYNTLTSGKHHDQQMTSAIQQQGQ